MSPARTRPSAQGSHTGKNALSKNRDHLDSQSPLPSRRSTRSSLAAASPGKPLSPPASTAASDSGSGSMQVSTPQPQSHSHDNSGSPPEEIAPEIVVWTEPMDDDSDEMMSDSVSPDPESNPDPEHLPLIDPEVEPEPDSQPQSEQQEEEEDVEMTETKPEVDKTSTDNDENIVESQPSVDNIASLPASAPSPPSPLPAPPANTLTIPTMDRKLTYSPLSVLSSHSEISSAASSASSKATTPVDLDSSRDAPPPVHVRSNQSSDTPRRRYDVRPKVSIPPDLPLSEYAMQCIAGAEASRLNPYALHEEEYLMLREHISHAQVTTYLNIRNGILRLWVRNPQIAVTREEAVGCAKDTRWFDVASVCFDWLVRRGFINFGCLEVRSSRRQKISPARSKQKTVVVIGAGMSGLGCARQLEGLFLQYSKKFREMGEEPPRVVVLEGRNRIGGRVYSRAFQTVPKKTFPHWLDGQRFTAEMGGMIITGFDRGNPLNILVRGQLGLAYHALRPDTTLYDSSGKPVDLERDQLIEKLYNDCLDRVSEYKFKQPTAKLIEGNRDLMDEGKDSSAEAHKTIKQAEEQAAAQPHAPPVSEQSMAPQVSLVPVSSDRATGRIHTEPGTPGAVKAAQKARVMGWNLKQGVSDEADLDLEAATKEPGATLGSVTDKVISQYKDLVDLTALDFRLINWHVANLEYSNATNYHQLSLQGWDIDAGNEWEGSHTMVVGGYQSVPRGLLYHPTPLNLRQKSPVRKITYTAGSSQGAASVECEDGFAVEADYVVNTIPLGVLKHGSVKFEPPLPSWKTDAIDRLGFGVLNKVILVYREPFWDQERDIFGVLRNATNRHSLDQKDYASQRGRFFQWFNVTKTSGLPVLLALMAGDAGYDTEQTCNDDLIKEATSVLKSVFGSRVPDPVEAIVTRWASDKFARGSYSSAGPAMKADDYDTMARPVGNLFFAGEHTTGTHPATVHGAYLSGLRAASEVLDAMLGPISVPTPLVIPKETSRKRKAPDSRDPLQARLEEWEADMWDHIVKKIGPRPVPPPKPAANAYIFYSKNHYEDAKKKIEAAGGAIRRGSTGKGSKGRSRASAQEVRILSAKMWKEATEEERRPYVAMAEEQKSKYNAALAEWKVASGEWDAKALEVRTPWEKEHPMPTAGDGDGEGGRRKRVSAGGYAEESDNDAF